MGLARPKTHFFLCPAHAQPFHFISFLSLSLLHAIVALCFTLIPFRSLLSHSICHVTVSPLARGFVFTRVISSSLCPGGETNHHLSFSFFQCQCNHELLSISILSGRGE